MFILFIYKWIYTKNLYVFIYVYNIMGVFVYITYIIYWYLCICISYTRTPVHKISAWGVDPLSQPAPYPIWEP